MKIETMKIIRLSVNSTVKETIQFFPNTLDYTVWYTSLIFTSLVEKKLCIYYSGIGVLCLILDQIGSFLSRNALQNHTLGCLSTCREVIHAIFFSLPRRGDNLNCVPYMVFNVLICAPYMVFTVFNVQSTFWSL